MKHFLAPMVVLLCLLHLPPAGAATLEVHFSGSGGGAVNSSPAGIACVSAPCGHDFADGTTVTLHPVAEASSIFTGWSGGCGGSGTCVLTMGDVPISVTSGFDLAPPVRLFGPTPAYFSSVSAALDAAVDRGRIQVLAGSRNESVAMKRAISLSLEGGFDAGFSGRNGFSSLAGTFTIAAGTLVVDGIAIATDTTPPGVLTTVPASGASGIPTDVSCSVVLSRSLDPLTVSAATFFLKDGAGRTIPASISVDDSVAMLTPLAPLVANATFTATLLSSVTDLAGNHLAQSLSWSFTTAPPLLSGILTTASQPDHLLARNGWLFWTESGSDAVRRMPASGGEPTTLVWNYGIPSSMALHEREMYWLNPAGRLFRTPLDGGPTEPVSSADNGVGIVSDLLVDDTSVYWVATSSSPNTYRIVAAPRAGGAATVRYTATTPIYALQTDGASIFWLEEEYPSPPGSPIPQIRKMPRAGGTPATLYSSPSRPLMRSSMALSGKQLVFAEEGFPNSYRILSVSVDGGPATELAAFSSSDPFETKKTVSRICSDGDTAYWLDSDSLRSVPLAGGDPTILAPGLIYPQDLAVDGRRVYWSQSTGPAHRETGTVKSVPKGGGQVDVVVEGGDAPFRLQLNSSTLFWNEGGPIGAIEGFGRIAALPLAGGIARTLYATAGSGLLAADDTWLYLVNGWRVLRLPHLGGTPEKFASADFTITGIATDGSHVFWVEEPLVTVRKEAVFGGSPETIYSTAGPLAGPAGWLRIDSGVVYWMSSYANLFRTPASGGEVTVIASGLPFMSDFTVDGGWLFFAEQDTGRLRRMPVTGGSASTLCSLSPGTSRNLAAGGGYLFWIDQMNLGRIPLAGGTPTFLVGGTIQGDPFWTDSITLDTTSIYWTERNAGVIRKAPLK